MTKGEQMLIDLGYTLEEKFYSKLFRKKNYVIEFDIDIVIEFDLEIKKVCCYESSSFYYDIYKCDFEEIQAIHQIMIDYGWNKDVNETIEYADQSGLASAT